MGHYRRPDARPMMLPDETGNGVGVGGIRAIRGVHLGYTLPRKGSPQHSTVQALDKMVTKRGV